VLDTLCIDAGGVLVNPNWERVAAVLRAHGVAAEAAALAAAEPRAKRELDVPGRVRATDDRARSWLYFDLVVAHARLEAAPARLERARAELAAYHARFGLWEWVVPGVPEALARLRDLGLRLVVVSNSNGTLRDKLGRLGLGGFFAAVIDSHEVGVEKPDPGIFAAGLAQAGSAPERALHLGDLYEVDVVGARAAGVEAVLVDPATLYAGYDCPRVPSLHAFADALAAGPA